jgi:transposase, IS5 family
MECIGNGKARVPYEFGCKVSIATPATAPKGGQFVLHAKALHGNPYDGHKLGPVIADLVKLTGVAVRRIHGDKGYRGHNYPDRFKLWLSGQVRRVTKAIRREMRRTRAATATASMPCFPLPATTSACSCAGSRNFCASCY